MYSVVLFSLCVFMAHVLIISASSNDKEHEKRILLDDQSFVQQQLDKLQSMLQGQQAQIDALTSENSALRNEINNGNKGTIFFSYTWVHSQTYIYNAI